MQGVKILFPRLCVNKGEIVWLYSQLRSASTIVSEILAYERPDMRTIYDPTCGSGSLLINIAKYSSRRDENSFRTMHLYGQEMNTTTYNLSRMNMILHDVNWKNFDIANGDTLNNDLFPDMRFDAIGANPPYSLKWEHSDKLKNDPRFSDVSKLAPKDKADFAFVQHIIYHLNDEGVAAVVLPHGVLFRGGAEGAIREHILKNNLVHAVIGLPENLFYGTSIPTVILVIKKDRAEDEGVLFVDASKEFAKGKNQNSLTQENIEKIVNTYKNRADVEKYAHLVSMDDVVDNDYNLNIPRYVDSNEDEEIIDLDQVQQEIAETRSEIDALSTTINDMIAQLHPVE